jgi:hypothetical protein
MSEGGFTLGAWLTLMIAQHWRRTWRTRPPGERESASMTWTPRWTG